MQITFPTPPQAYNQAFITNVLSALRKTISDSSAELVSSDDALAALIDELSTTVSELAVAFYPKSQSCLVVPTYADALLLEPGDDAVTIRTEGYYEPCDFGGAVYKYVLAEPSHEGKFQAANGRWYELSEKDVTFQMFGSHADYGTGNTDASAAINNAFAYWRANVINGVTLRVIGRHYVDSNLTFNFNLDPVTGFGGKMWCGNPQVDGFYMATGRAMVLDTTSASFFEDVSFRLDGNNDVCLLKVGDDAFVRAWNKPKFGLVVNNNSQVRTAVAVRFNYVLHAHGYLVVNGGGSGNPLYNLGTPGNLGYGTLLQLCQTVMCGNLVLGLGNGNVGIHVTGGSTNANHFTGLDVEEVYWGIVIDSSSAVDNTFNGGKVVAFNCINATAGLRNRGTAQLSIYPGGSYLYAGGERFGTLNRADGFSPFARPASSVLLRNTSGRRVHLRTTGDITVATITKADGNAYGVPLATGVGEVIDLALMPYDAFTYTYTGSPTWHMWSDD